MKPSPSHLLLTFTAALLLAACSRERDVRQGIEGTQVQPPADQRAAREALAKTAASLPDFSALVALCGHAVVNVDVIGERARPTADERALRDFFGVPGGPRIERGAGSGFIVSPDGYILTNAHVVEKADTVTVRLTDRREFAARVIGTDARTDVAVLKIDATELPVVQIGNHRDLKAGEWVLAIGSPFGLDNTATAGIVSGTARSLGGEVNVPFIQTDVAVNPGNSGGPLFNLRGEVVGINSMIFSQSGGYMGISFAIPIDVAMQVRDQLVSTGRVVRGRIGVVAQDVDAGLAKSFGLERPRGALVSQVEEGGPADDAGLEPGDIILKVGGRSVERSADLSSVISSTRPGTETSLDVWRARQARQITVRVERLHDPAQRTARVAKRPDEQDTRLGLVVRPLTRDEKAEAETEGNVVVADVQGSAARAGLQPGDIIIAVNNREVKSVKDLRNIAGRLKSGDSAALLVERAGTKAFIPLVMGAAPIS
jgi:serine protease Do